MLIPGGQHCFLKIIFDKTQNRSFDLVTMKCKLGVKVIWKF